jgi:DNA repair ATPase RecN
MSSIVWLFQEHRDTVNELYALREELARVQLSLSAATDQIRTLLDDNRKLGAAWEDAVQQAERMRAEYNLLNTFEAHQRAILQELPYTDGRVPTTEWLTPGDDEPVNKDIEVG